MYVCYTRNPTSFKKLADHDFDLFKVKNLYNYETKNSINCSWNTFI